MTKNSLKWLLGIFFFTLIFYGCEESGEPEPDQNIDDENIAINDTSAFNMTNFLSSFEQSFFSFERWAWNFTHNINDGKATESYQNYTKYGDFGLKAFTIQHSYNSNGVVISSKRLSGAFEDDEVVFTYGFDEKGNITKLTKSIKGKVRDIVHQEYNDKGQLIKKTHEAVNEGQKPWVETFVYNDAGQVTLWETGKNERMEFTYSAGKMVEVKEYYNGEAEETTTIEYDDNGRVIKESENEENYQTMEYNGDLLTVKIFWAGLLQEETIANKGGLSVISREYRYNDLGELAYVLEVEYDTETQMVKKKSLSTGTVDALELVGYSIVNERHEEGGGITKESFYNADDELLYSATYEFVYDELYDYWYRAVVIWFDADGVETDGSGISEEFVYILMQE